MSAALESGLREGLVRLGLELESAQIDQLLGYADLLAKWARVYNLTALRSPQEILTHHLLDSLSIARPLMAMLGSGPRRVADAGSGAGLPGAVLAICFPDWHVDCIDAVAKKAAFVQQAAGTLALPNLRGVHARLESVPGPYGLVTSRAFASLADFVAVTAHSLAPDGVWAAMKGKYPDAEVADLPHSVEMFHVEQLEVPGLEAERCLVWMRRRGS